MIQNYNPEHLQIITDIIEESFYQESLQLLTIAVCLQIMLCLPIRFRNEIEELLISAQSNQDSDDFAKQILDIKRYYLS